MGPEILGFSRRKDPVFSGALALPPPCSLWTMCSARAYAAFVSLSAASPASRRRTRSRSPSFAASMMLLAMASRTAVGWGVWPSRAHAMSNVKCGGLRVECLRDLHEPLNGRHGRHSTVSLCSDFSSRPPQFP